MEQSEEEVIFIPCWQQIITVQRARYSS